MDQLLNDRLSGTYDVDYWPEDRIFMLKDVDNDTSFVVPIDDIRPLLERYYGVEAVKTIVVACTGGKKLRIIPTKCVAAVAIKEPIDPHAEFLKENFTTAAVERALEAEREKARRPISEDERLGAILR